MSLDFTKPVKTRDGRMVEIYTTTANGEYPVVGQVFGETYIRRWELNGLTPRSSGNSHLDLVQAPETIAVRAWLNVFPDGNVAVWRDRMSADRFVRSMHGLQRVACIEVQQIVPIGMGLSTEVTSVGETRFIDTESLRSGS